MAEDLVTLGFAFSSGNAENEINKLISAFNNLDEKSKVAKTALGNLFGGSFTSKIDLARKSIGKFNAGLLQTASFAKKAVSAIKPLPAQISNVSADKIKPVPASVIESLQLYANSARAAAEAMTKLKDIPAKLSPVPVKKLGKEIETVKSETLSLLDAFKQTFATGTFAMYFKKSTQEAVRFGEELAHISSLTMDYDVSKMRSGILNISSVYGSATKNAESLYYAFSSGVRGGEDALVKFTGDMAKLATLIRAGVTPTVDAATSAMNAYNLTARNSGELVDLFYAIVKQGKAHGEQLASGLGQVISTAATAGVTLNEMGASVASLTKVMQTRNAITYFNNMLSKMIKPTKECRLAAEKLGIELGLDALKAKGFAGMMEEIHNKTRGSQQAILSIFPDLRGQRAALQLLNKGWGDFQTQLEFFANKSGIADAAMSKLTDDVNYQLSVLPNTFSKIKIAVGDLLIQTLSWGGVFTPLIKKFNEMGESSQTAIAGLTLLVGGYITLKTSAVAYHAVLAAEIRNKKILAAQHASETAKRAAATAAIKAETAAKQASLVAEAAQIRSFAANNAAIAQKIRMQAVLKAEYAGALAVQAAQTEMDMQAAIARGNLALAQKLEAQFKQQSILASMADTKAVAAETAAIRAEAAARGLNAKAASLEAAAVSLSGGAKTKGIVSSIVTPISIGATAAVSSIGMLKAIPGAILLGKAIGGLAPALIKVSLLATGLNTTLTTGVGGALAITSVNATALATGLMQTGVSILHPIASLQALGTAGAAAGVGVAGTAVAVGSLVVGTAALGYAVGTLLYQIPGVQKALNALGETLYDFFTGELSAQNARSAVLDMQLENYNRIKEVLGTADAAQREVADAWKNAADNQLEGASKLQMLYSRQAAAEKKVRDNSLETVRAKEAELAAMRKTVLAQNATGDEVKRHKEKIERMVTALDQAKKSYIAANQELIASRNAIAEMRKNAQASVDSVKTMLETRMLDMMTPEQRNVVNWNTYLAQQKKYYDLRNKGEFELAEKAAKSMLDAHSSVMKFAKDKIQSYQKFQSGLKTDAFDYLLKATESLPDKLNLMRQRAQTLWNESGVKGKRDNTGKWSFQIPSANADLEQSYRKAKDAILQQRQALVEQIKQQKSLAQAEQRANENTLKLVQSMDKFKATTATAVNAYSLDALQLQSREFSAPAKIQPITTAQTGLGVEQAKLASLDQTIAILAQQFQKEAAQRESNMQRQKEVMEKNFNDFFTKHQGDSKKDSNQEIIAALNRLSTEKLETLLKRIIDNVSSISTASY